MVDWNHKAANEGQPLTVYEICLQYKQVRNWIKQDPRLTCLKAEARDRISASEDWRVIHVLISKAARMGSIYMVPITVLSTKTFPKLNKNLPAAATIVSFWPQLSQSKRVLRAMVPVDEKRSASSSPVILV